MSKSSAPWGLNAARKNSTVIGFIGLARAYVDKARSRPYGNSRWIETDDGCIKFYLRFFNPPGFPRPRLEVANVNVAPRGRGMFTAIIERLEQDGANTGYDIFIESILNPRLVGFFRRRGYKDVIHRPMCLIKDTSCDDDAESESLPNILGGS